MPPSRAFGAALVAGLALAPALFGACSGDGDGKKSQTSQCPEYLLPVDCDPIDRYCGFPFPSNVYLGADPDGKSPSGKIVRFGAATLPKTKGTTPIAPELFRGLDGFSPASTGMTYMPGATGTGLPTPATLADSVSASSPTILLDADTGELVPHWVDLDQIASSDDQRALLLHPAVLLRNRARYIVAMRRVVDAGGAAVPSTAAFQALRDGTESADPTVEGRRCLYDDIFAKLEAAGVGRADLQIAWDFTVGSKESITGPMVKVRDAALAAVGADGPEFTLAAGSVVDNPNADILRRFVLAMKAPLYLTSATYASPDPVPHLQWDAAGNPQQNGTMDVDVLVQIPNSVATAGKHGLLQNGHGLFGSKTEGQNGYLARQANGWHWITLAVDYFGFSGQDVPMAAEGLDSRPELLPGFIDRQIQGQVNQLVAMRLLMGRVARDGVRDAQGTVLLDPAWVDASVRAYRGDSQGGIMGATYMSVSTDVVRGYLGEPGTPYSVLLNRSADSVLYNGILDGSYGDGRAVQLVWGLIQLFWDRSEPSGFAPFLASDMLPGTPSHRVLLHDGLGDHQVSTYGAHILARAVSAKLLRSNDPAMPVVRDVFGLEQASAPLQDESALVEWDFALPPEPLGNVPPLAGCDPHDRIRVLTPTYEQEDQFLRTGTLGWFCDGICNCDGPREEGGCLASYQSQCCPAGTTDPLCP